MEALQKIDIPELTKMEKVIAYFKTWIVDKMAIVE
jgi:hypothetical protein